MRSRFRCLVLAIGSGVTRFTGYKWRTTAGVFSSMVCDESEVLHLHHFLRGRKSRLMAMGCTTDNYTSTWSSGYLRSSTLPRSTLSVLRYHMRDSHVANEALFAQ